MTQTDGCMFHSAYHHHGDSEVGSQLVVTPGAGGPVAVLVDAFFMHQVRVFLIGVIWGPRHPETCFEGLLQLLVPLGVRDEHLFTCRTVPSVDYRWRWEFTKSSGVISVSVNMTEMSVSLCVRVRYHLCALLLHRTGTVLCHEAPQASEQPTYWDRLSPLLLHLWTERGKQTNQTLNNYFITEWNPTYNFCYLIYSLLYKISENSEKIVLFSSTQWIEF